MSFTFGGINCESMGMIVEKYPDRVFPQRKQTVYSVTGRSGDLIVDEDAYTNVVQEYVVFVKGGTVGLQTRLSAIASWLLGTAGYRKLTDTYDPSIYRLARVANAVDFLNSLNRFGKATIEFDCQPQRFPTTDEVLTGSFSLNNSPLILTYPSGSGLLPAYPVVEITIDNWSGGVGTRTFSFDILSSKGLGFRYKYTANVFPKPFDKLIIDTESQSVRAVNGITFWRMYITSSSLDCKQFGDNDFISFSDTQSTQNVPMTVKVTTKRFSI